MKDALGSACPPAPTISRLEAGGSDEDVRLPISNRPVGRFSWYRCFMSTKAHILQTVRRLAIETGSVPSMGVIAQQAGVSKGGLMHHFSSRNALVEGIAVQAIRDLDQALTAAAERGTVVETWLRLSSSREEAALYRAMSILLTDRTSLTDTLLQHAAEATRRWEHLFTVETGDPVTASIIRLLGDGMLLNSLADDDTGASLDSILQWLNGRSPT